MLALCLVREKCPALDVEILGDGDATRYWNAQRQKLCLRRRGIPGPVVQTGGSVWLYFTQLTGVPGGKSREKESRRRRARDRTMVAMLCGRSLRSEGQNDVGTIS